MKYTLVLFCLLVPIAFPSNVYAVTSTDNLSTTHINELMVKDFVAQDLKTFQIEGGKKLNWLQRTALKSFQKNLEKKIRKGKIDAATTLKDVDEVTGNKRGLLSIVFSVAGLLFLFIPGWVGYLGIVLSAVGIYFGIKGMQKDEDTLLALIGAIVGALVLLLNVIVLL